MHKILESFIDYCNNMMIANETRTNDPEKKFNSAKDVIDYLLKIYKPDKNQRYGGYRDESIDINNWKPKRIWIDDIGRNNITSKDLIAVISKSHSGKEKEFIGYISSWINDDPNDVYNKYNNKCIEKLKSMKLVPIADDCGGSEIDYDLESKKFYLFDHDYGFIPVGLSMKSFMSLCSKYKLDEASESFFDMIATESVFIEDKCTINFFGKSYPCHVEFTLKNKEALPEAKKRLATFLKEKPWNDKKIYDDLFKANKILIDDVNKDPYFDGKKVNNGNDLLKSIERIDTVHVGMRSLAIAGSYWLDDEHGFSISFPNGKYVPQGDKKRDYYKYNDFTTLNQHSDYND